MGFKILFKMLCPILIIILIAVYIHYLVSVETFQDGYGTTFGQFYQPIPPCTNENNCFKGFETRGAIYTNMCEPSVLEIPGLGPSVGSGSGSWIFSDRLLRTKRPLQEEWIKVY